MHTSDFLKYGKKIEDWSYMLYIALKLNIFLHDRESKYQYVNKILILLNFLE